MKSGTVTKITTDSTEVVVVDRRSTPYGSGWWPSAYLKLVAAGSDRVLVGPSGTAAVYRGNGDSVYLSPPGDFSTLVKTASGWELRPRGSTAKLVFDANGRLYKALDPNGNRDSIAYSGTSDQITTLVDPVGKTIAFAYDGNGKLSTLTDPGSRQSKVTINGSNQLTYDSISSPTTRALRTTFVYQAYPGTNTAVLWRRIGVIGDTTVVTYDSTFRRRPTQVTLPRVQDETGANVTPVVNYTAYERRGFGSLGSLDSVYVELKDPRNNWTRSLLNRWGEARRSWDALGLLGRAEFTAEGFARWAEGKIADSSRAYSRHDALGRVAKTFIIRATGDTLRTDSLVYDANHRVIVRIDARGKRDSVLYDANGDVLQSITPNGDVSKFWYRTDGLLDSTRAPGANKSRKFAYDATWKNVARLLDESNTLVDSALYDGVGRDTAHLSKVRVQVTADSGKWQWRRSMTFYNVANQVDSTRLFRTNNCNNPCNTPPAWPAANDTTRTLRVGHRFDRAGRDSLRLNDRGKAVLYLYDRLGRVVSRRPWTDSLAVKDSFVYDIAGNLKKSITRRGDTFTTNFDSRNRDTLSVVPGVGTLRKAFTGPLDQLTRLWYDTPVDSIGGVNAELRWGFDQRGRLKADTSYTGATVRATTYAYDTFERVSTTTDAIGTWTTRYETNRGIADTLLTPMGDSVTYVFDNRGRAVGPYIRGGGPLHSRLPVWTALAGELSTLSDTVSTAPGYVPLKYDRNWVVDDPQPAGSPVWTEQRGSGASVDSLQDSLLYDGWNRVIAMVSYRNMGHTGLLVRDTFAFDRAGNLKTTAGVETYDATTDRLLSRSGGACGTWSYSFDRAGNLTQAVCGTTTWTYGYSVLNQLRTVKQNGTLIVRYAYDVLGRRIGKRVYNSGTGGTLAYTRFVYRGGQVAFETDSAGTIGLRYTWGIGADNLLAIRDAAGNHYYTVQDLLSSVRGLVKRDGTWVRSLQYGAYGAVLRDTSSATAPSWELRYRWTGREYDAETGLYFLRARYYDSASRRFLQEDPVGYGGGDNVYAYAEGNPVEARDPSGLKSTYDGIPRGIPHRETPRRYSGTVIGDIFDDDWGVGGGFWRELDAVIANDDLVWGYQEYKEHAADNLDALGELGNKFRALKFEEYTHVLGAIRSSLGNQNKKGWQDVHQGVSDIINGQGTILIALADGTYSLGNQQFTLDCGPANCDHPASDFGDATGRQVWLTSAGMLSRSDGFIANYAVHESLHGMGYDEPDSYAGAFYWTGFPVFHAPEFPYGSLPRQVP